MRVDLAELTSRLARLATHYDLDGDWPQKSLDALYDYGVWKWVIPREHGGALLDPHSQTLGYEAIAAGCMTCALIVTQRDAACELIAGGENEGLKSTLLPRLAQHQMMTSVGISQVTTSHQTGRPAMAAKPEGEGYVLRGFMPWVTGAARCQFVVTAAVLPDGRQLLAVLPLSLPGVNVDPPMKLMALEASLTSEIHCKDVYLELRYVIRGPLERVLSSRSTVKPLVVSATGIGLAGALLRLIEAAAKKEGPAFSESAEECAARYQAVRERLMSYAMAAGGAEAEVPKTEIRVAVNDLLVRLAVTAMTLAKGSGFLRQRDAQRLVREAMFFLVWSAPEDVRAGTLSGFLSAQPGLPRSMPRM